MSVLAFNVEDADRFCSDGYRALQEAWDKAKSLQWEGAVKLLSFASNCRSKGF
jgi:hypothetical protein